MCFFANLPGDNKIDSNVNGQIGSGRQSGRRFAVSTQKSNRNSNLARLRASAQILPIKSMNVSLKDAGAIPWRRDPVDQRIVEGVRNQTGRIIKSQNEVGGWPNLKSESSVDGPRIYAAGDANQSDESGYTKLEIYLNSLCHNRSSD